MNFSTARLQRTLEEAPVPFRLSDYISRGFQFMNDNMGMLVAFTLLSGVINFICQSLPYVGFAISIVISPVLRVGYSQFIYMVKRGNNPEFGEFFKGFSKIGPLIVTYLLVAVISLIAMVPGLIIWYKAGMVEWLTEVIDAYPLLLDIPDLSEMVDMSLFWIGLLVMLIAGIGVSLLFLWSLQIAWFYEIGPLEALDASRKLIARNWEKMLAFLILSGLIAVSGVLLCGVGVLYTAPAMTCAQFFAFSDATRLLDDNEENQTDLIDHFIA